MGTPTAGAGQATGVPRLLETPPSQDPTVGIYMGPMVVLGEGVVSFERGTPVVHPGNDCIQSALGTQRCYT